LKHATLTAEGKELRQKRTTVWVLVAHARNPGYSGGRDWEDHGLKPALANSFVRPYHEKNLSRKRLVEQLRM
jgi:hypothetical protein